MSADLFLDASFAIALSSPPDANHEIARILAKRIKTERIRLVTTAGVILEIGNELSKLRYRQDAIKLLHALRNDHMITVVPLTETLLAQGFDLYRQRSDKEWGLTDCVSFVAMKQQNITDALTADRHFQQAGFVALLLETPHEN